MTGADADTCRERTQEGLRDLFIAFRVSARKAQQRLLIRNQIISAEKHVFIQKDSPLPVWPAAPDEASGRAIPAAHPRQ